MQPKVIADTLEAAMRLSPETLAEKGECGRRLVREQFTWDRVAIQMSEVYGWVSSNGLLPHPSYLR
jgi:glycosyltransferase involved in cell wall biosynthesis